MNGIFAYALQILTGVLDQSRAFFDALSLHAPSILAAVAVLALSVMAAVVVLDASRRTAAVPAWSYLRQDVAQLAADRDSKRSLLDSLRAECRTLEGALEGLRAEKAHLTGLAERREEQEAALRDLSERLASLGDDRALVAAIRAELDGLRSEKSALGQEIAAMQAERADRESGLVRLRNHEAKLEDAVSALKASREATSAHVNQMQMELDALRGRIETARAS